ncbi:MAG: aromatic ring-hydroxylating dioxygenase subunit alpha [Pseudomonadota bacterium]
MNQEILSLEPRCYTNEAVVADETARLFRTTWIGVGRADRVRAPGDVATLDVAGQSIVLARDKQGRLHAFANSCRHRGARLLDGTRNCTGLRCPFHSWFYALDGRLLAAPHMEAARGFDRADYGLVSYRAAERAGFVFLCLAPQAPDLDAQLGDFESLHSGWPLASLTTVRRRELEVDCNWKLFLDVFNEYYHLPFVHPNSIDSLYAAPDPADTVTGAFATQFGRTEGTGGLLEGEQGQALPEMPDLSEYAKAGARYTWVYPNMTFAANRHGLWCYEAYPITAQRCKVVQSACFPPESLSLPDASHRIDAYLHRLDAALDEDVPALVNQQRGMACPDARAGRFHPALEPNVQAFAEWYRRVM